MNSRQLFPSPTSKQSVVAIYSISFEPAQSTHRGQLALVDEEQVGCLFVSGLMEGGYAMRLDYLQPRI